MKPDRPRPKQKEERKPKPPKEDQRQSTAGFPHRLPGPGLGKPVHPRGSKPWSIAARRSWRAWRNYYPSLAYARNDPHTLHVAIDHAAKMVGINQTSFYNRYLLSKQLPYVVMRWRHGKDRPRRKSFVLRSALMELMTRQLCQEAKRQYARRSRRSMADLERELEQRSLRW